MKVIGQWFREFMHCRLCWKVTAVVFLSIMVIQIIILVPSYIRFCEAQIKQLDNVGKAAVESLLNVTPADKLNILNIKNITRNTPIKQLKIFSEKGNVIANIGNVHENFSVVKERAEKWDHSYIYTGAPHETYWKFSDSTHSYYVASLLSTETIFHQLKGYVYRIIEIILIVALFVTAVLMVGLRYLILLPVIRLRKQLILAEDDPEHVVKYKLKDKRQDEIGDVNREVNQLFNRMYHYLNDLIKSKQSLSRLNESLEGRVEEATKNIYELNEKLTSENAARIKAEKESLMISDFPEHNKSPVFRVSAEGLVTYQNKAASALMCAWKCDKSHTLPKYWGNLVSDALRTNESKQIEVKLNESIYLTNLIPVKKGHYVNFYCVDITERKLIETKLQHVQSHDTLTHLPGKAIFEDRLKQAIDYIANPGEKVLVATFLVQTLNQVNSSFGYSVGDSYIKVISDRLLEALKKGVTFSRLESNKFGLIYNDVYDLEDVTTIIHNVKENLIQLVYVQGKKFNTQVKIGVALYPEDGKSPEELVRNATLAMLEASSDVSKQYQFFQSEMNEIAQRKIMLAQELSHAIEENQFDLHYQPQIDIQSGEVVGCEALLRWHHPELGNVPPTQFIPLAEESGLIFSIGDWVIKKACHQLKILQESGYNSIRMAINLSPLQFRQKNLSKDIQALFEEMQVNASCIELEVTESLMTGNLDETVKLMHSLKSIGVKLAVDDFGTGYSSLSTIKDYPIDHLKIDKSFVDDMLSDPKVDAIIKAILDLSESLNIRVIAEGVETKEQVDYLKQSKCEEIQGYYFSKPLPADALEDFLKEHKK